MGVRRPLAGLLAGALLLATSACGGDSDSSSESSESTTPSRSASPTPTPSPSNVTGVGGRLLLVPADSPGKLGRCTPAPKSGVVCSSDRRTTYRFQPDAVRTLAVSTSLVTLMDTGDATKTWVVQIKVGPAATRTLAALTTTAARTRQTLLVLLPGTRRLLTAPMVNAPITTGDLQISGSFTQASAAAIVRQITSTAG